MMTPAGLLMLAAAALKIAGFIKDGIKEAKEAYDMLFKRQLSPEEQREFIEHALATADSIKEAQQTMADAQAKMAGSTERIADSAERIADSLEKASGAIAGFMGIAQASVNQGMVWLSRLIEAGDKKGVNVSELRERFRLLLLEEPDEPAS